MSFKNPNAISSISREEFENLKKQVDDMNLEIKSLKDIINTKSDDKTIKNNSKYNLRPDMMLKNAIVVGAPRIDYFNFSKKTDENSIIDIDTIMNKKRYTMKSLDSVPNTVKTFQGHRPVSISVDKIENIKSHNILGKRMVA